MFFDGFTFIYTTPYLKKYNPQLVGVLRSTNFLTILVNYYIFNYFASIKLF